MNKVVEFLKKVYKWVAVDGMLHFCVSALLMVVFGWVRPVFVGVAVVLAIGIAKEVRDIIVNGRAVWRNSLHDLLCDVLGVLFGLLFVYINTLAK